METFGLPLFISAIGKDRIVMKFHKTFGSVGDSIYVHEVLAQSSNCATVYFFSLYKSTFELEVHRVV
jgi:hypothetical protein